MRYRLRPRLCLLRPGTILSARGRDNLTIAAAHRRLPALMSRLLLATRRAISPRYSGEGFAISHFTAQESFTMPGGHGARGDALFERD